MRPLHGEDLRAFNRFSVWVYADAPGFYSVFVGCTLFNGGKHIMPVPGRFEGQHFETIYPNQWRRIVWEIPDLYRDSVTGFGVNIMLTGSPRGASERLKLYIDDMRIEAVDAENSRGFNLRNNAIAYSHSGYLAGARNRRWCNIHRKPGSNSTTTKTKQYTPAKEKNWIMILQNLISAVLILRGGIH